MTTATAATGKPGRSPRKLAEKLAQSQAVASETWIVQAIEDYARDLGVAPEDLTEGERLEAIEDGIDLRVRGSARATREAPATPAPSLRPATLDETAPDLRAERQAAPAPRRALAPKPPEPAQKPSRAEVDRASGPSKEVKPAEPSRPIVRGVGGDPEESSPAVRATAATEGGVGRPRPDGAESSRFDRAAREIEERARRNEERTARALESIAGVLDSRRDERLDSALRDMERRAEASEERMARALEAMASLAQSPAGVDDEMEAAVRDMEARAQASEARTASALEAVAGLVAKRGDERGKVEAALRDMEARAQASEARAAQALETLAAKVQARGGDGEWLDSAMKRMEARAERNADRMARALESMSGLAAPQPASKPIEPRPESAREAIDAKVEALTQRANRAAPARPAAPTPEVIRLPAPAAPAPSAEEVAPRTPEPAFPAEPAPAAPTAVAPLGEDDEAIRLAAERLARRRKLREANSVRAPSPRLETQTEAPTEAAEAKGSGDAPSPISELQREMRTLSARIGDLSSASNTPAALEAFRTQARDIETALAACAERAAPVARIEKELGELAGRIDGLVRTPAPASEVASALKALADMKSSLERNPTASQLAQLERRIDELGGRVEAAARRTPAEDKALQDLGLRLDQIRASLETRGRDRPDSAALNAHLAALNEKLDRAAAAGAHSAKAIGALQDMAGRLEDAVRRPVVASLDAKPIEELARRIDNVRGAVERQDSLSPKVDRLHAALGELAQRLDQPPAVLQEMAARIEDAVRRPAVVTLDGKPIEDLARRIDNVRGAVERQDALSPKVDRLHAAVGELALRLEQPPAAMQEWAARMEDAVRRPVAAPLDAEPIEDLARRIDDVREAVQRQDALSPKVDQLHAAVDELAQRLEQSQAAAHEIASLEATLLSLSEKVEHAVGRNLDSETKSAEALGDRIESLRESVERSGAATAQIGRLEETLSDVKSRLDSQGREEQIGAVDASLRRLAAKLEEAVSRPATVSIDPRPIEDLARRIESVRASLETSPAFGEKFDRLEEALGVVAERLEVVTPVIDANGLNSTLAAMNARLEEAFSRPASIDFSPLDELSQRIEAVRESIDRQSQQFDEFGHPIDELTRRLDTVQVTLERQLERLDDGAIEAALENALGRLETPFGRADAAALAEAVAALAKSVESPAEMRAEMLAHMQELARKIDHVGADAPDLAPLFAAVAELTRRAERAPPPAALSPEAEESLQTLAATSHAARLDAERAFSAISQVTHRVERAEANLVSRVDAAMDRLTVQLESHGADPEVVARLAEAVRTDAERAVDAATQVASRVERAEANLASRVDAAMEQFTLQLESRETDPADITRLADAVAALVDTVQSTTPETARHVTLLDEVADRLGAMEIKLDALSVEPQIAARQGGGESAALAQEVRDLRFGVEELALAHADGERVDNLARSLADKLGKTDANADAEAVLAHVGQIHERLDDIVASRPAVGALDRALRELTEELEDTRAARAADRQGQEALAALRADQQIFDRRLDARFTGLQDVLETLLDRLGRLESQIGGEGGSAPQELPYEERRPASSNVELHAIPDREPGAITLRPAPAAVASESSANVTREAASTSKASEAAPSGAAAQAKNAAISAHIAAARRAANAALAGGERRAQPAAAAGAGRAAAGWGKRAQGMLAKAGRPMLLGAGVVTLVAAVAALEWRASHLPQRHSAVEPGAPATPLAADDAAGADMTPLGAVGSTPKVTAAPLAAPGAEGEAKSAASGWVKAPPGTLIAALPAGLPSALTAAASEGQAGAEIEIAQRFLEGRGVPRDPKVAAGWLQSAAEAGAPFAQYRLAALYEKGVGVARDLGVARDWYGKAANAGNARAMHNLAVLEAQDGGSGKPDYATAVNWFTKAAAHGVRDSQFNLGVLYGRGLGATQDLAASWMWFSIAAKQGDNDAARKRDEVALRMDGKLMAKATKMLADFKVEPTDAVVNDPPPFPADAAAGSNDDKPAPKS